MAANNDNRHGIIIDGDITGLATATERAERILDGLSNQAMSVNGILGTIGNQLRGGGGINPAMLALGAAAGVAASGIGLVMKSAETANKLDQLAQGSQMNVEYLQQLGHAFGEMGMTVEQFGGMNRDALKNLGQAVATGGGLADDLKKYGQDLKDYTQFLGASNGGVKAAIHLFYQLRDAGASMAEITSAMEKMSGGSSQMIGRLQEQQSEQEALNSIQDQNVDITEDAIAAYRRFSSQMGDFQQKTEGALANGLAPFVTKISDLYDWFEKDWKQTSLYTMLSDIEGKIETSTGFGAGAFRSSGMGNEQRNNLGKSAEQVADEKFKKDLEAAKKRAEETYKQQQKNIAELQRIKEEEARANAIIAEREREKAAQEAEKARKQAEAEAKRLAAEAERNRKEQARLEKEKAAEAERIRKENVDMLNRITIEGYAQEAAAMSSQTSKLANNFNDLETLLNRQVITEDEYHKKRSALIEANKDNFAKSILGASLEDFQTIEEASKEVYERDLQNLQTQYDQKLVQFEEFQARKKAIEEAYSGRSEQLDKERTKVQQRSMLDQLDSYQQMTAGMSAALAAFGGENSKAAQAAFAMEKGLAISKATIDAYTAFTDGMSTGGVAGYALAAAKMGAVFQQIASIKAVKGQFHSGIDNVPSTGTYLLEAGERVVDKRLNQDLKDYMSGNDSGGSITVHAPLTVQGNVRASREEWLEMLKMYKEHVKSAVQDAQRRSM
ncbi:hypothetical protein [Leclercia sp. AS011]|uniref:hypothetical protein n=1 Tax=Leclercia sp. AS011 TaxID=3081257 RepID=UPI003016080F